MTDTESSPHIRVLDMLLLLFGNYPPTVFRTEPCLSAMTLKHSPFACPTAVHGPASSGLPSGVRHGRLDQHVQQDTEPQGYTDQGTPSTHLLDTVGGPMLDRHFSSVW